MTEQFTKPEADKRRRSQYSEYQTKVIPWTEEMAELNPELTRAHSTWGTNTGSLFAIEGYWFTFDEQIGVRTKTHCLDNLSFSFQECYNCCQSVYKNHEYVRCSVDNCGGLYHEKCQSDHVNRFTYCSKCAKNNVESRLGPQTDSDQSLKQQLIKDM